MKKLAISLCFAGMLFTATAKAPADTTVAFTVEPPMSCVNCENKIKSNLRFEKGIKEIDASASRGTVEVKFNPSKTSVEKIVKAFGKVGYKAIPAGKAADAAKCCQSKAKAGCGDCGKEAKGSCCGK